MSQSLFPTESNTKSVTTCDKVNGQRNDTLTSDTVSCKDLFPSLMNKVSRLSETTETHPHTSGDSEPDHPVLCPLPSMKSISTLRRSVTDVPEGSTTKVFTDPSVGKEAGSDTFQSLRASSLAAAVSRANSTRSQDLLMANGLSTSSTGGRLPHRRRFYKTRLCPYHFKKGSVCKGAEHCSYAHSFHELRPSIDLTKTKLCHDYLNTVCVRRGCPFAHGTAELRQIRTDVNSNLIGNDTSPQTKVFPNQNNVEPLDVNLCLKSLMINPTSNLPKQPPLSLGSSSTFANSFFYEPFGSSTMESSQTPVSVHSYKNTDDLETYLPSPDSIQDSTTTPVLSTSNLVDTTCDVIHSSEDLTIKPTSIETTTATTPNMAQDSSFSISVATLANIIYAAHYAPSLSAAVSDSMVILLKKTAESTNEASTTTTTVSTVQLE